MLDNLFNLVKQHAGNAIINNPAIPNEQNDEAVQVASTSIFDGLKNAISGGNVNDIMSLFSGNANTNNNPVSQNIQGNFIQNLISKFGLNQTAANGVASNLIPNVLQNLISKTNDPNDNSFDLKNILSKIGGGNLNIQSLINQFSGNNNQNGGGIVDTIKGIFNK